MNLLRYVFLSLPCSFILGFMGDLTSEKEKYCKTSYNIRGSKTSTQSLQFSPKMNLSVVKVLRLATFKALESKSSERALWTYEPSI